MEGLAADTFKIISGIDMRSGMMRLPFPHLEIYEVADKRRYIELLSNWLPRDESGWKMLDHPDQRLPDGTYGRLQRPAADLDERLDDLLCSDRLRDKLFDRLGMATPAECYPFAFMVDDAPGYWIRKHPDTPQKIATLQWYFALPDDPEIMGTRMCDEVWEDNDRRIPWLPNWGYAFEVTDKSFHEVRRGQCPRQRRSIQVIWYRTPEPSIRYV